jgi:hypothetical protein
MKRIALFLLLVLILYEGSSCLFNRYADSRIVSLTAILQESQREFGRLKPKLSSSDVSLEEFQESAKRVKELYAEIDGLEEKIHWYQHRKGAYGPWSITIRWILPAFGVYWIDAGDLGLCPCQFGVSA